jgi:hypothetical protein
VVTLDQSLHEIFVFQADHTQDVNYALRRMNSSLLVQQPVEVLVVLSNNIMDIECIIESSLLEWRLLLCRENFIKTGKVKM